MEEDAGGVPGHPAPLASSNSSGEIGDSFFLQRLPPEIRIQIYRVVFQGSKVVFQPGNRKDRSRALRKGHSEAFNTTNQWQIMLTCRQCYHEARKIFWQETLLYGGSHLDAWSADFLSHGISDYTRTHVRHLRYIWHQSLPRVLEQFDISALRTCEINFLWELLSPQAWSSLNREQFVNRILPRILRLQPPGPASDSSEEVIWHQYLRRFNIDPQATSCIFLVAARVRTSSVFTDDLHRSSPNDGRAAQKTFFMNLNTGKIFSQEGFEVDDEGGFRKVMS